MIHTIRVARRLALPLHRLRLSTASAAGEAGGTFRHAKALPRLPIPDLQQTCAKYLSSAEPLFESAADFAAHKGEVADFLRPGGAGEQLQAKLRDFDERQPYSWLDSLWMNLAYLDWRDPIMINVNWWCQFRDHPRLGVDSNAEEGSISELQLARAAHIAAGLLHYRDLLASGTLPPDYQRSKAGPIPLDMWQYTRLFQTTRIPLAPSDAVYSVFPPTASHIVVLLRNHVYKVEVPPAGKRSAPAILAQLRAVRDLGLRAAAKGQRRQPNVPILTSANRDLWTEARAHALAVSPRNQTSLKAIEESLFAIALDDYSCLPGWQETGGKISLARSIWHGKGGANRFYDKALTIVMNNDGRGGVNAEHSPSDAVIPAHILNQILRTEEDASDNIIANATTLPSPTLLEFEADVKTEAYIEQAATQARELIEDTGSTVLAYEGIGADVLKGAKVSPDAAIQMTLQLAYFLTHGESTPTYETASTRQFAHGRTETIRTLTAKTRRLCERWHAASKEEKLALLADAIKDHIAQSIACTNGQGVDRHFLGLRAMLAQNPQIAPPAMFKNPVFGRSGTFKLSTSNVSPAIFQKGGFGPVATDGYGINYSIGSNDVKYAISWKRSSLADGDSLAANLRKVLAQMQSDLF